LPVLNICQVFSENFYCFNGGEDVIRIGELLQVTVADIISPERKILLQLGEKNNEGRVMARISPQWTRIEEKQ